MTLLFIKFLSNNFTAVLVFLLICIATQIAIPHSFGDPDGWYHLGMGQLYRAGWEGTTFPWLPHTVLSHAFFDQQWAYHWLLTLSPTVVWAKILTIIFCLAVYCITASILKTLKINQGLWWTLAGFALCGGLLARMSLTKGGLVGVALYLASVHALLHKKVLPLFLIGLVWPLFHGSFLLLLPLVVSFGLVANCGLRQWLKNIFCVAAGVSVGLLLHPGHSALLPFFSTQLTVPFTGRLHALVGAEWYPFSLRELWNNTWPLLASWAASVCVLIKNKLVTKSARLTLTGWLVLQSLAWFVLFSSSKRFIEYWAPLAIITVALGAQLLPKIDWHKSKELFLQTWQIKISALILVLSALLLPAKQIQNAISVLRTEPGADRYEDVAKWLAQNSQPGDVVFNTRWDSFPQLFYWNKKNYYTAGLDQLFLYNQSPDLYRKYMSLTGQDDSTWNEQSGEQILKTDFKARFVLINKNSNPKLFDYFKNKDGAGNIQFENIEFAVVNTGR